MKKTKIVATIGPSSDSEEMLEELIKAGMNTARLNMSHSTYKEHLEKINKIKKLNERLGTNVSIMIDTKGPEIRLGDFKDDKALLIQGKTFILTTKLIEGTDEIASVTYSKLPKDVNVGGKILLSDGLIELEVKKIKGKDIICKVKNTGVVKSKKGINVPGCKLSFPVLSVQDKKDILFGVEQNAEYIAISFVRDAEDIKAVRKYIDSLKVKDEFKNIKIIAKIENEEGIENFDEILEQADGIMVARGDMGVEVPLKKLPIYQKEMIKKCIKKGKIAITATQMLESMIQNPRPTRAEVSDVANAIYDSTTAIMLSGETASGNYPKECVEMMSNIATEIESNIDYWKNFKQNFIDGFDEKLNKQEDINEFRKQINFSVCTSAMFTGAKAIVSISHHGKTPEVLSSLRPGVPIYVFTANQKTYREMSLMWGVEAVYIDKEFNFEKILQKGIENLKENKKIKSKDIVILAGGTTTEDNESGSFLSTQAMGAVIRI